MDLAVIHHRRVHAQAFQYVVRVPQMPVWKTSRGPNSLCPEVLHMTMQRNGLPWLEPKLKPHFVQNVMHTVVLLHHSTPMKPTPTCRRRYVDP